MLLVHLLLAHLLLGTSLLGYVTADEATRCTAVSYGHAYGDLNHLPDGVIARHFQYVVTKEAKDPCNGGVMVGKTVIACDYDVPPTLKVFDLQYGEVLRHGDLEKEAVVKTVAVCVAIDVSTSKTV